MPIGRRTLQEQIMTDMTSNFCIYQEVRKDQGRDHSVVEEIRLLSLLEQIE